MLDLNVHNPRRAPRPSAYLNGSVVEVGPLNVSAGGDAPGSEAAGGLAPGGPREGSDVRSGAGGDVDSDLKVVIAGGGGGGPGEGGVEAVKAVEVSITDLDLLGGWSLGGGERVFELVLI